MDVAVQFHVILHNVQNVIHIQSVIDVITVDTIIAYARTVDTVALVDALVVLEEIQEETHHVTAVAEPGDAMTHI